MSAGEHRRFLRIVAWLLTPVAAWAASFLGGWLGALVGAQLTSPVAGLVALGVGAALGALGGAVGWVRLVRRWLGAGGAPLRRGDDAEA